MKTSSTLSSLSLSLVLSSLSPSPSLYSLLSQISEFLSTKLEENQARAVELAGPEPTPPSVPRVLFIYLLQTIALLWMFAVAILPAYPVYRLTMHLIGKNWSLWQLMLLAPTAYPFYGFALCLLSIVTKWVVLGPRRSDPIDVSVWSVSFVRWWLVYQLLRFTDPMFMGMLKGTVRRRRRVSRHCLIFPYLDCCQSVAKDVGCPCLSSGRVYRHHSYLRCRFPDCSRWGRYRYSR
jgi:hypothetical protein